MSEALLVLATAVVAGYKVAMEGGRPMNKRVCTQTLVSPLVVIYYIVLYRSRCHGPVQESPSSSSAGRCAPDRRGCKGRSRPRSQPALSCMLACLMPQFSPYPLQQQHVCLLYSVDKPYYITTRASRGTIVIQLLLTLKIYPWAALGDLIVFSVTLALHHIASVTKALPSTAFTRVTHLQCS